ncbi:MAG: amino acid adenylation domain-containing protein [Pyrinomonadaceae bacterium]|nr:amino acid adenylation domain-containing protein [Pyrinomonadaceae bacterium]
MSTSTINIREQLAGLSPAKRALIEMKLLKKNAAASKPEDRILRRPEGVPVPLSYYQQGLWVLSQLMPDTPLYHVPKAVRLSGKLDVSALQRTIDFIVNRHEALRTSFTVADGVPLQVVNEIRTLEMLLIDLSHLGETERETEAHRRLGQEARRTFDLSSGPMIRAALLRLQDDEHILLLTMHHIVTDGWSVGLLQRELMALYEAFANDKPSPLAELPVQYPDFACWQREWFQGDVYQSQLRYWKERFKTLPPVLELPTDHPRPLIQAHTTFRGTKRKLKLSRELTRQLREVCQKEGATLFMVLLAAYQVLLHRYTGEEDIVVGSPIAGRCMEETENLIGLFVNALALRTDLSGDPTFRELLARVKEVALGGYVHQDMPFEMLVKELQPDRALTHNPLFQVMFVLQSEPMVTVELPGLTISHVQVENIVANFDLTLDAVERDGQLECEFESNADLFDEETIMRLLGHFETLLEAIVANPAQKLSDLPLMTQTEESQLLIEWNNTATDYPREACVNELFADQVARTPDEIAVEYGNDHLTFQELNRRANQLAHYLLKLGVGPDVPVGVRMERSLDMMVALVGIVKAGGAYLPLDLSYPESRIAFMLADAQAPVLLTQKGLMDNLPENGAQVFCLDERREILAEESEENPANVAGPDNLIYIIYTSGSTGVPKGVSIPHRAVTRLVLNTDYVQLRPSDRIAQVSNASFDAATFEIWGAFLTGARLVGIDKDLALSPKRFAAELRKKQISMMFLTTALFNQIAKDVPDAFSSLRQLMFGGEAVDPRWVREVLAKGAPERLLHVYGPTETTTFATWQLVESVAPAAVTIPIGRPIANTRTYILNRHLKPVPVGVKGELFIGGDGLAREYLNRAELTKEKFIADPFNRGSYIYRTGDIARYLPNGAIEFVGRVDHQVKIRGFRIELGEIESALSENAGVQEAVVTAHDWSGDRRLVAYVVSAVQSSPTTAELRNFLQQKLPDYMVPSAFVMLERFPLTPNGKVNREALPAPESSRTELEKTFAPPQDELELKLARIWEKVLAVGPIGIDENFFELGGHSLLAVRLFAQLEKSFGKNLPLATLFQAPTVRLLAQVLRKERWSASWSSLVVLQNAGTRRPFFCVHAAGGNVLEYHALARLVGPDQPFYGLQAQGLDGNQAPHTTIKDMAAHYIKEMRDVQPEGPYLLGGRSSGGTVAFEMACQLAAVGEQVDLLALLDTYPAGYFKLLPNSGSRLQRLARIARTIQSHRENLQQLTLGSKLGYIASKLKYAPAKTKHKVYGRAYKLYERFGRPLPRVLRNIEELTFAAVKDYVPQVYSGRATLFLAGGDLTAAYDVEEGWQDLIGGGLEKVAISGNHLDIVKEPHVRVLAEKLRAALDRAQ